MVLFFFLSLLILLIFPSWSLEAAVRGLMLWFYTLLPTLFPFMVLSDILRNLYCSNSSRSEKKISILTPLKWLLHLSDNGCLALLLGILCGFPLGARICAQMERDHQLSPLEAQFLLPICNMASPSFIISFLVAGIFKDSTHLPAYLFCLYMPLLIWGIISGRCIYHLPKQASISNKSNFQNEFDHANQSLTTDIDKSIMNGIINILKLGGYIILFSLFAGMIHHIPFVHSILHDLPVMLLEISIGSTTLCHTGFPQQITILCILTGVSFGGLSFLMQTNAMIQNTSLSLKRYAIEKAIISIMTALLSLLLF